MFKKIFRTIISVIVSFMFLCFAAIFVYFIAKEDSIIEITVLSVLALFCCRMSYILIKDVAFIRTEYIKVVNKIPTQQNNQNQSEKKHSYSALCIINGKERRMYFKSKDDYFKIPEHKECVVKRVGNQILEIM